MTALQILFLITAVVTFVSGLMVVTARNLVHAALALVASLFGVAVLFAMLEAGFLAVVQVTLYIGAIAILIIFAIMLTRKVMQDTGPQRNAQWLGGAIISALMFLVLSWVVTQIPAFRELSEAGRTIAPVPADSLQRLGLAFVDVNQYVIPFEVASVMLLVAFIGAIVIAGDKK